MKEEFIRFRLTNKERNITGVMQILGGAALLFGFFYPLMGLIAAGGLSLLMLLGFIVRLKLKDSIILTLPSFIFMILNGYLFLYFLQLCL